MSEKILAGRRLVEAYRTAHTKIHAKGWHKGVHKEHTPLLNAMKTGLAGLGFESLGEFFSRSAELGDEWM